MSDQRLVVYTVLTGAKEALGDPLSTLEPGGERTDLQIDWVCFTDNPQLRSERWQIRLLDEPLPPERSSRRPKCLPHEYLADWEHSLYIDNIVRFSRLPTAAEIGLGASLRAFRHATRKDPMSEAEAIVQLGYESVDTLAAQLDFYRERGLLQKIEQLSTCTLILRRHQEPQVRRLGQLWWEQFLLWGKRDQMSFDIALQLSGAAMDYWPGLKNDCPWLVAVPNVSNQRVLANFDAARYRWRYRHDPAAQANPRQHYLAVGAHDGRHHGRRAELFDWLCYRMGSSLGTQIAPKRGVAGAMDAWLQASRASGARLLVLGVLADPRLPCAFADTELDGAANALASYLAPAPAVRIDVTPAMLASGKARIDPAQGRFGLAVVLGAAAEDMPALLTLLAETVDRSRDGQLLFVLRSSLAAEEITGLQRQLAEALGLRVSLELQASAHEDLDAPLSNSLLALRWRAAAAPGRRLLLQVDGELASRLQAVACAQAHALASGRQLLLNWRPGVAASPAQLFGQALPAFDDAELARLRAADCALYAPAGRWPAAGWQALAAVGARRLGLDALQTEESAEQLLLALSGGLPQIGDQALTAAWASLRPTPQALALFSPPEAAPAGLSLAAEDQRLLQALLPAGAPACPPPLPAATRPLAPALLHWETLGQRLPLRERVQLRDPQSLPPWDSALFAELLAGGFEALPRSLYWRQCPHAEAWGQIAALRGRLAGRRVGVLGGSSFWAELLLAAAGAAEVISLRRQSAWTATPPAPLRSLDWDDWWTGGQGNVCDMVLAHGSLEAQGLGRDGRPLQALADLLIARRLAAWLKPEGLLLLGLPVGPDLVEFNSHRVYGAQRLRALEQASGLRCLGLVNPEPALLAADAEPRLRQGWSLPTLVQLPLGEWRRPLLCFGGPQASLG